MRIGIDISQLAYPNSGVAVYTRNLVTHLLRLDKENEYVFFGSSLRRRRYLSTIHFNDLNHLSKAWKQIFPFPISFLEQIWNKFHMLPIEQFLGAIDVFHTSDWLEPPAKAPKVTTIHDLLVYKYPSEMHPTIVANQRQKLRWVKKESARILVDSESTKQDVIEYLGIEEERLRVVYLGVEEQFVPQSQVKIAQMQKKYALEKNYILTLGTIEPRKNIDRVIKVFNTLKDRKDLELVIIGRFVWGENLRPTEGVKIFRGVQREDLATLYSGACCFVYPSLYEGFGLPVLEAMACGCRVVTSNRGSLKEVAGEAAIIVDPENVEAITNGIETVLKLSNEERGKLVKRGQNWTKQFTWEKTAKETLRVYQEIEAKDR